MDAATFRTDFPEFADTTAYPDATVNFWLGVGVLRLNPTRWVDLLDFGLELFTAHQLVIAKQNTDAAVFGGVPGTNTGAVSAESVDKVSVAYDVNIASEADAGYWNLSTYGTQFINLARMAGMGGIEVGAPTYC